MTEGHDSVIMESLKENLILINTICNIQILLNISCKKFGNNTTNRPLTPTIDRSSRQKISTATADLNDKID